MSFTSPHHPGLDRPHPNHKYATQSTSSVNVVLSPGPGKEPPASAFEVPEEPVRLSENAREREMHDAMAELYAIILVVERLEKAYVKDAIKTEDYHEECTKLIAKFKTIRSMLSETVPSVERFMTDYGLDCPAAKHRLLSIGVPATVEFGGKSKSESQGKLIAETTQFFITCMDNLKLDMISQDQVQPLVNDLVDAIMRNELKDFGSHEEKLKNWLITLNGMNAHDELSDTQVRQLLFDLESAYTQYHKLLAG